MINIYQLVIYLLLAILLVKVLISVRVSIVVLKPEVFNVRSTSWKVIVEMLLTTVRHILVHQRLYPYLGEEWDQPDPSSFVRRHKLRKNLNQSRTFVNSRDASFEFEKLAIR